MHTLETPRLRTRLESLRAYTGAICVAIAAAAAIPTALFIYDGFAADGGSPTEAGLAALIGAALLGCIVALHHWGLHGIPDMTAHARKQAIPLYYAGAILVAVVAGTTSVSYVAGPGAERAALERAVDETAQDRAMLQAAIGEAGAARQVIGNANQSARALLEAEAQSGGICQSGRNQGPCTSALLAVSASLQGADSDINQSLTAIDPMMRRASTHFDNVERIARSERLTPAERLTALEEETATLSVILADAFAALPLEALQAARTTLARDFTTLGLPLMGGDRLNAELRPFGPLLQTNIDALRDAAAEPPHQTRKLSTLALIGREWDHVGLLACALLLLELIPMLLVTLNLVSSPGREERSLPPYDDDPPTGASALRIPDQRRSRTGS